MKERDKERETKNSKREWDLDREKKTERGRGSKRETKARQQLSSIIIWQVHFSPVICTFTLS